MEGCGLFLRPKIGKMAGCRRWEDNIKMGLRGLR